jgi:hypothetical protein
MAPRKRRDLTGLHPYCIKAPQNCRGKLSIPQRLWSMRQRCSKTFFRGPVRNRRFCPSLVGERGKKQVRTLPEDIGAANTDDFIPLLGPAEVAKWLGVSVAWVRDHATRKSPRLPAIKAGKLLRFRPIDVRGFIHHYWDGGDVGERRG